MMRLLLRPKPDKGESFIGYLVRLTELNGYETPSWILSLSGIDYMELQWKFTFIFSHSDRLKKLAELTENTLPALLSLLYSPSSETKRRGIEDEYNFYGAFLNRSIVRPHCPKVCPACLNESGYARSVWDCSLVTACPIHECLLIDNCPECQGAIRCLRNKLSVCSCGCDWREVDQNGLSEHELAVSRQVYKLCGIGPVQAGPLGKKNINPLESLGLRDLVLVLTFIAGLDGNVSWATGRPARSIRLRNTDLHGLFTNAYMVFENWPYNFHQFLNEKSKGESRLNPHDGKLDTSLKREFGSFYERLYQHLAASQFDFMREAFAHFLTSRLKAQAELIDRSSSVSSSSDHKYISLSDGRRILKITHRALFDLIAAGEIEFVLRNRGTTLQYLLRLPDVERMKHKFDESLTTRALAKELGVECEVVRDLARQGRLKTRWRPAVDGYHTIKFDRDSVQELLNSGLIRNAPIQSNPSHQEFSSK